MLDGSFNNIASLRAEELPKAFGCGKGLLCDTEEQLDKALSQAMADDDLYLIRARVPKGQISGALKRLTDSLKAKV
jgi:thiamine pyrophosphate-dependent acetolactate synthase large subunit-like protein